jgi:hypothetical protein
LQKIIGTFFEVHKFLGNGFQEVIYQRALQYEMHQAGLTFQREIGHWFSLIEGRKLYWVGIREKRSQYKLRRK